MTSPDLLFQQAQEAQAARQYDKALEFYGTVLSETAVSPYPPLRFDTYKAKGRLLIELGRSDEALQLYQAYYQEVGSSEHAVKALQEIGRLYNRIGQWQKGLAAHREELLLAKAYNNTNGRALAYSGIANSLMAQGQSNEAIKNLNKALSLFEQTSDRWNQMSVFNQLGICAARLGQFGASIHCFEQALGFSDIMEVRHKAITLANIGESYRMLFHYEMALVYHQEAFDLAQTLNGLGATGDIERNLGLDLIAIGQIEKGLKHLHSALAAVLDRHDSGLMMQAYYSLVIGELANQDVAEAQKYADLLHETAQSHNNRDYLADALHALGLCAEARGETAVASQFWQQATLIAHEVGEHSLIWRIHADLARVAENPAIAQVHRRIAAEIIDQIAYPIEDAKLKDIFLQAKPVQEVLSQLA